MKSVKYLITIMMVTVMLKTVQMKHYDNYKVYKVIPINKEHIQILKNLKYDHRNGYDFWTGISGTGKPVDIMVPPELSVEFNEMIKIHKLPATINIENVQTEINKQRMEAGEDKSMEWTKYHRMDTIYAWLNEVAKKNAKNVEVVKMGWTHQKLDILGVHISFSKKNKKTIFIQAGVRSGQWITTATATYLINEIVNGKNDTTRNYLQTFDWYIAPISNPDGYRYTWIFDRFWRKNRAFYADCYGVDLGVNWNASWLTAGASLDSCFETFAGPGPFSEPETKSLSEFISKVGSSLHAFINFMAYGQELLIPYGNSSEQLGNYEELYSIGKKAIASLSQRYGTKYRVLVSGEDELQSGSSVDWVKATFGTRITYTYMFRDTGLHGLLLPADQIIPNSIEVIDSLITILKESLKLENLYSTNN